MYHADTQRLLNRAERMGRELAAKYDGHMDNLKLWINSAIKAEINLMARDGMTVKESMDRVKEPYND